MIEAVLFDLGDTLIYEQVDDEAPLDLLPLIARPYADELLSHLAVQLPVGLITDTETSAEPAVRRALANLGLEKYFTAVVTSQDVGVVKPDRRIFAEALRRLKTSAAGTVMVGNDASRDVVGAAAMGMYTVLVTDSPYYDPATAHLADARVANLQEVMALIDTLRQEQR